MTPEARKVADILRRDVPKPKILPVRQADLPSMAFRWENKNGLFYCPMGLHPLAIVPNPFTNTDFPLATDEEVAAFAFWWDFQTNHQKAVDAIWGPNA